MAECNASSAGAQFVLGADGSLSPLPAPSLALAWSDAVSPHRVVLAQTHITPHGALRFIPNASSGQLTVTGGCKGKGDDGCPWDGPGTGHGRTCLDSACGNRRAGDCLGPELYRCMGRCCTCNQMWKLVDTGQRAVGGRPVVRVMNGLPGPWPSKPESGCHRSQQCLAACAVN